MAASIGNSDPPEPVKTVLHPGPEPTPPFNVWKIVTAYGIFCLLFAIASGIGFYSGPATEYEREVHSHYNNALIASTPELIRSELIAMKEGMRNLSLSEDLYAGYYSWEKTPHTSMAWQYQRIDAAIQRVDDVIAWRDSLTPENTTQLKDVYNEKIQNLHTLVENPDWDSGRHIDGVAWDAYMLNYHPFYAWWWIFGLGLPIIFVISLPFCNILYMARDRKYDNKRWKWDANMKAYEREQERLKAKK